MDIDNSLLKLNQFAMENKISGPQYQCAVDFWNRIRNFNIKIRPPFIIKPWDLKDAEKCYLSMLFVSKKKLLKLMIRPDGFISSLFVDEDANSEKLLDCSSTVQVFDNFKAYLNQLIRQDEP